MFHKKGVTVVWPGPLGFNWWYETIVRQKGITIGKLSADYFGARIIPSLQDGGIGWGGVPRVAPVAPSKMLVMVADAWADVDVRGTAGLPPHRPPRGYPPVRGDLGSPTPPTTQRVPACPRGPRVSHPTDHPEGTRLSAGTRSGDPHYFLPRVEKKKRMKVEVHIC